MEISINLNEENSERLKVMKETGILKLDLDKICNDAIKKELDNCEKIFSEYVKEIENR